MSKYILLTGATGLVGNYLLRDLILRGNKLAVVARASRKLSVTQRIECIMQRWERELGRQLPRPIVFEGDVTQPGFGLGQEDQFWIQEHCDQIIHNAAILQFHGDDMEAEPWKTNLGGTKNAIEFARLVGIKHFHYVSTAYVCGERSETVYEDELECGQSFRNTYENSKFRGELLVHAAEGFESKTVYRPAVIVGDSKTGYTSTYHGLFLYLRLLATLVPQQEKDENGKFITPIELPMSGDEPRNLVPVDWVSQVISHIVNTPAAHNRTFHLVPDKCSTARDVIDACYRYFNSDGVVFGGQSRAADSEFASIFFENARVYESYETSDPRFDNRNLKKFAGHIPCPAVDQDMIIRFMEFGVADNWGKKKSKRPDVPAWFAERIGCVVKGANRLGMSRFLNPTDGSLRVGINVHGPGGGQWQLVADKEGCEMLPGLPCRSEANLEVDSRRLAELSEDDSPVFWMEHLERALENGTH